MPDRAQPVTSKVSIGLWACIPIARYVRKNQSRVDGPQSGMPSGSVPLAGMMFVVITSALAMS